MKLPSDSRRFIELLNSERVEFIIVGGHAVAYHGFPRFTGDIDVWIRPSPENAARLGQVLSAFGFNDVEAIQKLLSVPGKMIQLGVPPHRIDILTSISGVLFEDVWPQSQFGELDGISVRFPSLESLLENKRASARPKDLTDVHELERVQEARTKS